MGRQIMLGNPPIAVDVRQSRRARRLSLRVSRLDGTARLTTPVSVNDRMILDFLNEKESWLRSHVMAVRPAIAVSIGQSIPFRGQDTPIRAGSAKRVVFDQGALWVPDSATAGSKVKAFLKLQARDALAEASERYAARVGRSFARLSLRDTRSRWGSCSSRGVLMYSWRLVMAPPDVLDYVAAHEVAHLVEMNHSPAFWSVVAGLMPDYAQHRAWLRQNGAQLHQVNFGD